MDMLVDKELLGATVAASPSPLWFHSFGNWKSIHILVRIAVAVASQFLCSGLKQCGPSCFSVKCLVRLKRCFIHFSGGQSKL